MDNNSMVNQKNEIEALAKQIAACTICAPHLQMGPRPVFSFSAQSKIVIIGQAPGKKVHESGIPWDDKSGENLRKWMGIDNKSFYDAQKVAIVPMGFCYPGKGKSGDLPPRKECAPQWHNAILSKLKEVKLILLIGKYAQDYYLKEDSKGILTETVKNYKQYLPKHFVLPHPSPRNNIWQAKNDWFQGEVKPELQIRVKKALA